MIHPHTARTSVTVFTARPNDQLTDGGPSACPELRSGFAGPPFGEAAGSVVASVRAERSFVEVLAAGEPKACSPALPLFSRSLSPSSRKCSRLANLCIVHPLKIRRYRRETALRGFIISGFTTMISGSFP